MEARYLLTVICLSCLVWEGFSDQDRLPANEVPPHGDNNNDARPKSVQSGNGPMDDSDIINLAEHPLCKADVERLCEGVYQKNEEGGVKKMKNSLEVLECFLNHDDKAVSADCHQIMWAFKKNITQDKRIGEIADAQCKTDLDGELATCKQWRVKDPGHFISCIVEEKGRITEETCTVFVNKVALVIFTDYRLVEKFATACHADIERLKCAFIDNKAQVGHSQGATIACLLRTLEKEHQIKMAAEHGNNQEAKNHIASEVMIKDECSHEVLRILELQADDFHLDRPLFFACRDDRERLCKTVQSGQGRVYQCLLQNKFNPELSGPCKEQVELRAKALASDYKVDYGLTHMCAAEIKHHNCAPVQGSSQEVGISYVVLCLEGVVHQGGKDVVTPNCLQAMQHQRQVMMSDFNISPNIVLHCKPDVEQFCKGVPVAGMIHCLMGEAQKQEKTGSGDNVMMASKISPPCYRELNNLLLAADVAGDVKVDSILYTACQNIIEKSCNKVPTTAHIMGCLMEHMHVPDMTEKCEKHLLETHYFVTRDIRLDAELYKACKTEATELCNLKDGWTPEKRNDQSPEQGPITFSCLYRHAFLEDKKGLSPTCLEQVKNTLHQRAIAMDIPPEVDISCIHDLAYFCADKEYKKGQEFNCLQEHYSKLQETCKAAVQHFTQAAAKDIKLSVTYQNCAPMLEKFCPGRMKHDTTFDEAMECLIPFKDDSGMNPKCTAEISHYQLVNIQEFQLNVRFKESCKEDVHSFCAETQRSGDIGEMVLCLSSILREDTVSESKDGAIRHRLSKACRSQLRHELLTRSEEAQLDPVIKRDCEKDIPKLCPMGVSKDALLECLRQHVSELSLSCHKVLFKVEAAQAVDEYADFTLTQSCKRAIREECPNVPGEELLACLVRAKNDRKLDAPCLKVVTQRQLEESKDIRLNPSLYKACNMDIKKYCSKQLDELLRQKDRENENAEENLVDCLRKHKKRLTESCSAHVKDMLKEQALNYRLDLKLADVCSSDIQKKCGHEETEEGKGQVIECLKRLLKTQNGLSQKCAPEVARMVADGKADIHIDPILYSTCASDLIKHCFDVPPGEGRQFDCLTQAMGRDKPLSRDCASKLKERVEFQKYAEKIYVPEDFEELAQSISVSPARNYFITVAGFFVLAILVVGICCGRATKRLRKELKNR